MSIVAPVSDASSSVASRYNRKGGDNEYEEELQITPSTLQVDYDADGVTELYKAITHQDWETAVAVCQEDPSQAATWVVRHYDGDEDAVLWRFLPLHSACARQPPSNVIAALLNAYSDAAACVDDQGMWALHYAAGNRASVSVIRLLLRHCRVAASQRDPRGMLPIHYVANWGPASMEVLELLLDPMTVQSRDAENNTPLDLALSSAYELRDGVVRRLQDATHQGGSMTLSSLASKASQALSWRRAMFDDTSTTSTTASGKKPPRSNLSVGSSTAAVSSRSRSESRHEINDTSSRVSSARKHASDRSHSSRDVDPPVLHHHESESISIASFAPVDPELSTQGPGYTTEHEEDQRDKLVSEDEFEDKGLMKEALEGSKNHRLEEQIRELQEVLRQKDESLNEAQQLYCEAAKLAAKHEHEADGLRSTLGNLMEQHESLQRKYSENKGRLESLTFSVESILEQQRIVKEEVNSILSQESARGELLEKLAGLKQPTDSRDYITASLEKQNREIDAVIAVIHAAKE